MAMMSVNLVVSVILIVLHGDAASSAPADSGVMTEAEQFANFVDETLDSQLFNEITREWRRGDSRRDIVSALNSNHTDGQGFTMFIPNGGWFFRVVPADAPSPFVLDDNFRINFLLGYLTVQKLTFADLTEGRQIKMANGLTATITKNDGETLIDGALIDQSKTFSHASGNIFYVDDILFGRHTRDQVREVFDKAPKSAFRPFFN